MKREYLLIFLIISISLISICTVSADGTELIKEATVGATFSDGELYTGLYGSGVEYECKYAHGQSLIANKIYVYVDISGYDNKKYFSIDVNFAPEKGLNSISLQTKGQINVSKAVRGGWIYNRWNSARVIYEIPDDNSEYGYTTIYINGRIALDREPNTSPMNLSQMRLSFNGVNNTELVKMYITKYRCYISDVNPYGIKAPAILNDEFTVLLTKLYCTEGKTKVKDIKFANATVHVYSDTTFSSVLDDESLLKEENIAVVKTQEGIFYYEIYFQRDDGSLFSSAIDFSQEDLALNVKNGGAEVFEDDEGENVIRFTNLNNYSNVEYDYEIPFAKYYDGIELEYEIMPEDISGVQFMTELGMEISSRAYILDNSLVKNSWNKLRLIYSKENQVITFYANDKLISEINCEELGTDTSYKTIRLQMFGKEGTSCLLKKRNVYYLLKDKNTSEGFWISDKLAASCNDLKLYILGDIYTDDLKTIYPDNYIVVDGFGNVRNPDEALVPGDYVIHKTNILQRFKVKQFEKDKIIKLSENDEEAVIILNTDEENTFFYSAKYSGNRLIDVNLSELDSKKINCFKIKKGGGKIKLMLWNTMLKPLSSTYAIQK